MSVVHLYSLLLCCLCGIAALIHTIVHVIHQCAAALAAAADTVSVRLC